MIDAQVEPKDSGKAPKVYPAWIVVDESFSMDGAAIDAVNSSVKKIHLHFLKHPVDAGKIFLGFVGFADIAEEILPLQDVSKVEEVPRYEPQGATNYGAAFTLLKEVIERDMKSLKAQGFERSAALVFFITDGRPSDSWEQAYKDLCDPKFVYRPHVISFGIGDDISDDIIRKISNVPKGAYLPSNEKEPVAPEVVLPEIFKKITATLFKTLKDGESGDNAPILDLPEVEGTKQMDPIRLDSIED